MAIALVRDHGSIESANSSATTSVFTLANTIVVGNHVIVGALGNAQFPTSCADSKGNTYVRDVNTLASLDPRGAVFSAKVTTQLVASDTITVTYAASVATRVVNVSEFSGLDATDHFDVGVGTRGIAATAADSGATATTAQADELVYGIVGIGGTITGGSFAFESLSPAWTPLTALFSTVGNNRWLMVGYRVVSATAAMSTKATWGGSRTWLACVATYKAAAAGGVTVTPGVVALVLATAAPTVTASNHVTVAPAPASLTLTAFAPTVGVSDHQVVSPAPASLTLSGSAPTVTASDHQTVAPAAAALVLTTFAPSVTGGAGLTLHPAPASLSLTAFAPDVVLTDHKLVTPGPAALVLATFAPDVVAINPQVVTPGPASMVLTTFAPTVATAMPAFIPRGSVATITVPTVPSATVTVPVPVASVAVPELPTAEVS